MFIRSNLRVDFKFINHTRSSNHAPKSFEIVRYDICQFDIQNKLQLFNYSMKYYTK